MRSNTYLNYLYKSKTYFKDSKIFFIFFCFICIFWCFLTFICLQNNLFNNSFFFLFNFLNIVFTFKIDNISLIFINLTNFLFLICIWSTYEYNNGIKYQKKIFKILLILLYIIIIVCFCVNDLLSFYIFFELTLIPMLLIIGKWGSRQRKIHAVYVFFLYTFLGSLLFLIAILILLNQQFFLDIYYLSLFNNIIEQKFSERFVWFCIFIAFCVKIPIFPFHLWLPEAHVEAPTIGSILLAGILLKLGSYGILRFLIPLYPISIQYFYPLISLVCILGLLYISFTALCQIDLKKLIAYSSIAHMSYLLLGLCSLSKLSMMGAIYLMLAHGFTSAGLFYLIGCLYARYHTRLIFYYGGLITMMPCFSIFLFFFILANISFPGTSNFISECLILIGILNDNYFVFSLLLFFIIFTAIYSLWFFNRLVMGQYNFNIIFVSDLNFKEIVSAFFLLFFCLIYGFFPTIIFQLLEYYCIYLSQLREII